MDNLFNAKCNITPVKLLKQHWTHGNFSFIDSPRPEHAIMLLVNGRIDFVSEDETTHGSPKDVIYLPKYSKYRAVFRTDYGEIDDYLICFDADEAFCDITSPSIIYSAPSSNTQKLFREIVSNRNKINYSPHLIKGLIHLLIDAISKEINMSVKEDSPLIEKVKKLLESDENISIDKIARLCSVSNSGLRQTFKEQTGFSPVQYRIMIKMEKAKYLLESTDMTIGEIAEKLDFFDASFFTKTFTKHVGMTPREYAKKQKI